MNKDVANKASSAVATTTPKGFESGCSQEDLVIPRVKLLQGLSPDVTEQGSELRPGWLINSLTKEVMPAEFIPILVGFSWIKFNPRKIDDPDYDASFAPGDIVYRTDDPNDPIVIKEGSFGPKGEKPKITKFMNFLCYFPGVNMPIVLSFSKTSYYTGKELFTFARYSGVDMFRKKYTLSSKQDENGAGDRYYVLKIRPSGNASEDEVKTAEAWHAEFSKTNYKIHDEKDAGPEVEEK
jgi:hypothetical protein